MRQYLPSRSFAVLVSTALHAPAIASAQELVQPWTFRSPSGAVELFVDPSEPHGCGPGNYRMSRDGEEVWARQIPFTLLDVLVRDDGSAAGYAYPEGEYRGRELVVAALDPDGSERWIERVPRVHGPAPCSAHDPTVNELRSSAGRIALGIHRSKSRSDAWWVFDWSSGRRAEQREAPALDPVVTPIAPDPPAPPSLLLPSLGRVDFTWPRLPEPGDDPRSQQVRKNRAPHRVYVDVLGRVWISELCTLVVHGFDPGWSRSLDLFPNPKTYQPFRPFEWMTLSDEGNLLVCAGNGIEEFAPSGERVGRKVIGNSPPRWMFQPGKKERWSIHGGGRIELLGEEGQLLRKLERGANGRWFQGFYEAAVAPDGTLAVLDEANPYISSRDPSAWVHLFSPTGDPLHSIRVADEFENGRVAFDGRRVALAHDRALLLLNADGSPIGRMTLPEELGGRFHYVFFSPDGREVWVFPHMRHEMFRFALP